MIIFEKAMRGVSQPKLARFARKAQRLAGISGPVDVLISSNRRLQELNRRFRKKNKATDVLSFPCDQGGDIAISGETAACNAGRYGHSATTELEILILHGMLHLAGFDHETDDGLMAEVEARLRSRLALPEALIERAQPPKRGRKNTEKKSGARRSR